MPSEFFFFFFENSALIMDTLKGSTGLFFSFSTQRQNFTGGPTGPDFPLSSHTVKNQCQQKD